MKTKKRGLLCSILSIILVFTLIPDISFGTETPVSGQITGFAPLETENYYFEGIPSEEDITSELPAELNVYLDGSSTPTAIDVTWKSVEDFDNTDFYFYSMRPVWGSAYKLSADLNEILDVPWITVFKKEIDTEAEPMVNEDDLEPIYVDEEEALVETGEKSVPEDKDSDDLTSKIFRLFGEESYAATETNTDIVYRYLTQTMGLNMAAACGVMTNINAESAMNPINLENTYNTKFGLTDAEYTKRVDEGKGAYKTKSGASRNFKTDYCGYGLCQWTSLGRRTNLLNKALGKKTSVGDINMQMEFLNDELTGSYSSVMNTLRSVPNNAQGAYMAAFVFCMNFEVPANTLSTSASRGKTCIGSGGYWQKYSGSSASTSGVSFLSLSGFTYPKTLKTGKGMTVKGYAISNYSITKVSGNIKDANNVTKYSASATPSKTVFGLAKFDSKMLFSKLAAGKYTYTISATDKSGKTIKATKSFTVSSSNTNSIETGFCMTNESATTTPTTPTTPTVEPETESTMDLYSFNYPTTLKKGKPFYIKGTVKSNYPLKSVTVRIVNMKKIIKQKGVKTFTGTTKSYNIKKLDSKLHFGKLAKGSYYYKVIVEDTKCKKTLLKKKFTVK